MGIIHLNTWHLECSLIFRGDLHRLFYQNQKKQIEVSGYCAYSAETHFIFYQSHFSSYSPLIWADSNDSDIIYGVFPFTSPKYWNSVARTTAPHLLYKLFQFQLNTVFVLEIIPSLTPRERDKAYFIPKPFNIWIDITFRIFLHWTLWDIYSTYVTISSIFVELTILSIWISFNKLRGAYQKILGGKIGVERCLVLLDD